MSKLIKPYQVKYLAGYRLSFTSIYGFFSLYRAAFPVSQFGAFFIFIRAL